jgi:hypothetical protein
VQGDRGERGASDEVPEADPLHPMRPEPQFCGASGYDNASSRRYVNEERCNSTNL